jgi:hypothetical protein
MERIKTMTPPLVLDDDKLSNVMVSLDNDEASVKDTSDKEKLSDESMSIIKWHNPKRPAQRT